VAARMSSIRSETGTRLAPARAKTPVKLVGRVGLEPTTKGL